MVIGSDGKWSKALKDAFIQASPAGRVKMPPPAFRALSGPLFRAAFRGREPARARAWKHHAPG
jgi:hypothetical protein